MQITLFIGDYAYSSWSLRGWLLLDGFDLPFTARYAHMRTPGFEALRAEMAPSRLVPALSIAEGNGRPIVVWETMAIAETLHDQFPDAGLWPRGDARPVARALAAEMHAGFRALRNACPMNMRRAYAGFRPGGSGGPEDEVRGDLDRLSEIWKYARARRSADGPFLFGAFSAADAFFAPVASRIATYGLEMGTDDLAYVAALLGHPAVRRWRAMAMADAHVQPQYELDLPARPDPHAPKLTGRPIAGGAAENSACPFTGSDAQAEFQVEVRGRILGFGDAFGRDKVAADPLAWPEVEALLS